MESQVGSGESECVRQSHSAAEKVGVVRTVRKWLKVAMSFAACWRNLVVIS